MDGAAFESKVRVLVIDDQKTMRSIMRNLLHQIGVQDVDTATDGEHALRRLRDRNCIFPDLILCDLHMERMDGLEFCNAVRRDDSLRNQHIPIIILTGDNNPMLHDVAQQVGAVSVVMKPITAKQLGILVADKVGFSFAPAP